MQFAHSLPSPATQESRHAEIARRYRRKREYSRPISRHDRRIREIEMWFVDVYGGRALPDDDAGRADAEIMAHHLVAAGRKPATVKEWLEDWAPWMDEDEADSLIAMVVRRPQLWVADRAAKALGVTLADRTRLGFRTIGAIDCNKAERLALRKERNRVAKQARRRAQGRQSRAEYLAAVQSAKPWEAAGVSRSTWFRRKRLAAAAHE